MKIKALVSFSGALTMHKGEIREYGVKAILSDYLQAGFIEEVKPEKPSKGGNNHESKRNSGK